MPLSPGDRLGTYEILSPLGKGGMGEVWKARDPRLNRDVAIKVSAQQFSDRFEREARAIAALNHTNICILHDIGPNYLVMELIEGPTLADRIAQGPIPLEEALTIAKQIASYQENRLTFRSPTAYARIHRRRSRIVAKKTASRIRIRMISCRATLQVGAGSFSWRQASRPVKLDRPPGLSPRS